jgi:hypothetical protein
MKKFQVTWVEKAYYTAIVEAESFEQAETMVEADFDSFFEGVDGYIVNESFMLSKKPVDYDNEVFYDEVITEGST